MPEEVAESILRGLYSEPKFKETIRQLKAGNRTVLEVFGDSLEAHQRITLGRNAAEMSADEFLADLFARDTAKLPLGEEVFETWAAETVVTADLVVGSLLKQLRDTGIAGREIMDYVSIDDIDGPAKQIVDTMLTALFQTKKSRFVASDYFR